MKWLRERKYRVCVALAAGMAAVLLAEAVPMAGTGDVEKRCCEVAEERGCKVPMEQLESPMESGGGFSEEFQEWIPMYGWWGTLYPKFCFSKGEGKKVKISFWLAKAFDW